MLGLPLLRYISFTSARPDSRGLDYLKSVRSLQSSSAKSVRSRAPGGHRLYLVSRQSTEMTKKNLKSVRSRAPGGHRLYLVSRQSTEMTKKNLKSVRSGAPRRPYSGRKEPVKDVHCGGLDTWGVCGPTACEPLFLTRTLMTFM